MVGGGGVRWNGNRNKGDLGNCYGVPYCSGQILPHEWK